MLWMMLPVFTAAGSALLAFFVMQARMEVVEAKGKEALAEANAENRSNDKLVEQKVRAATEETRRRSMDEFLGDFRVEERHYMKESKSLFLNRKSMVLQERLYFRNIPLSDWVSRELAVEEGSDIQALAKACSVFSGQSLAGGNSNGAAKLLR